MVTPIITAVLAGALLVLQQLLMMSVGMRRLSETVGVGTNDDPQFERLIRRHGNLAENAPIFLLALGFIELLGASTNLVLIFAMIFFVARISHMLAFTSLAGSHGGEYAEGSSGKVFMLLRSVGAGGTAFLGLVVGGYLVYFAYPMFSM